MTYNTDSQPESGGQPSYDAQTNSFSFGQNATLDFFATLCLKVTGACAASCAFCSEPDRLLPTVPAAHWKPLIEEAAKLGTRRFSLSGGEPLLYFDFVALLRIIKEAGGSSFLATAAPDLLGRMSGQLQGLLDSVRFSVLGVGDFHDRQLGRPGSFAALQEAVAACRQHRIEVFASTVATTQILPCLDGIVRWAGTHGISKLYVFELLDSGRGREFRTRCGAVTSAELLPVVKAANETARARGVAVTVIPNHLLGANVLCYADGRVSVDPVPTPTGQVVIGNWRDEGMLSVWKAFVGTPPFLGSLSERGRLY